MSAELLRAATTGPIVLCAVDDLARLRAVLPPDIRPIAVLGRRPAGLVIRDAEGRQGDLRFAPTLCLGILTFSESGLGPLGEAARELTRMGVFEPPEPRRLPEDANALRTLLATDLMKRLSAQAVHIAKLSREMAQLRQLLEQSQNAFADVEAQISARSLQKPQLAFENPPTSGFAIGGFGLAEIRQTLPVSSLGLGIVELHFVEDETPAFRVTLSSLEDDAIRGVWRTPARAIEPGWVAFSLSRAIAGPARTVELRIEPEAAGDRLPLVSLGAPQPLRDYRALDGDGIDLADRSLAIRLWLSLPNVRPLPDEERAPGTASRHNVEPPLSEAALGRVRRVTQDWDAGFEVVHVLDEDRRGLHCHPPPAGEITVAVIDQPGIATGGWVTAEARVESPQSAPIEFSLAFSPLAEEAVVARLHSASGAVQEPDFAFSGWSRIRHGEPGTLRLQVVRPLGRLYFATRMHGRANNWYAWATFREIAFAPATR